VYRPGFTITTTGRGLKTQTRRYVAGQRDFVTLLAVMQMEIIGTVGFRVWGGDTIVTDLASHSGTGRPPVQRRLPFCVAMCVIECRVDSVTTW